MGDHAVVDQAGVMRGDGAGALVVLVECNSGSGSSDQKLLEVLLVGTCCRCVLHGCAGTLTRWMVVIRRARHHRLEDGWGLVRVAIKQFGAFLCCHELPLDQVRDEQGERSTLSRAIVRMV